MKKLLAASVIFSSFIFSGCAQKGLDLSSGELGSLVMFDRESFLARPTSMDLQLDFESLGAEVLLNTPADVVRIRYELPSDIQRVYVREANHSTHSGWAINRVMVRGEDFFHDSETGELFINLGAPPLYLISSNFAYELNFVMTHASGDFTTEKKVVVFHWKPVDELATESSSEMTKELIYFDSLAAGAAVIGRDYDDYTSYSTFRELFADNLINSQTLRLDASLCTELSGVVEDLNLGEIPCSSN
ncbi:hypothetical protein [Marinospirillum perlucidum]|uniref:hypothetical protein n=1 Tax=Marinospirillum perlucidum TaxID=1982602 RepID=UPI000DF12124|nr:hypothetical protein [Marinospirillum perlucidum]